MERITTIENCYFEAGSIITIGTFDGVHLGHKKLLSKLNELKTDKNQKTLVFTFEPHPRKVLFPEQSDLQLLTTTEEKTDLIREAGTDVLLLYPFTKEFAEIDPDTFITEILIKKLNVKKLVIGYDHKFGRKREGDIHSFRRLSGKYHYEVEEIPVQEMNEMNISSTKIRKLLFEGNVMEAALLLGYNYYLSGTVIEGKKLGRTIGYPTANLLLKEKDKLLPKTGVYLVKVLQKGNCYWGMMNLGINPTTTADNKLKAEVNIFNFDRTIYNEVIKVEFIERIREEEKFASIDELKNKIKSDEKICQELIKTFS